MNNSNNKNFFILAGILTPYRLYFFDLLYQECKARGINFKVLVTAEKQPDNNVWTYDSLKTEYTYLFKGKVLTISNIFIHINIGLANFLKKNKPDVIVSGGTYLYPALWTILRYKKKLNYKVFYWSESHLYESRTYGSIKLYVREWIRNIIFKKFDGFWYAGKFSLELINRYALPNAKKIFVPNLINNKLYNSIISRTDKEKDTIREKYHIQNNKIVLVCPARLTWVKGHLDFLRIFVKSKVSNKFVILLVGSGDLESEIAKFISQNNQMDIKLLGYKSQQDMLDIYSISNFLLLPSLSDPNPLTCIEALWCGLPLLISNHVGNYPEVIKQGENGYVFDYSNENELLEIIEQISNKDTEWYANATHISLSIAKEIYDSTIATKKILDEFICNQYIQNEKKKSA